MLRFCFAFAALTLPCAFAWAEDVDVKLPSQIKGDLLGFEIKAESNAKVIRWVAISEKCRVVALNDAGTRALFTARKAGTYRILVYAAKGDIPSEPVIAIVEVVDEDLSPLPPNPNPVPPAPNPTPPQPLDPLAKDLVALYAADTTPDKDVHLRALASVYRAAVEYATDEKKNIESTGKLLEVIQKASAARVPGEAVMGIRRRLAAELKTALPSALDAPLTREFRDAAANTFSRIASILGGIK